MAEAMGDPRDLVHRWLDGFNARDVEVLIAVAHPAIVLRPMRLGVHAEYHGHEGLREWLAAVCASPVQPMVAVETMRVLPGRRIAVEGELTGLDARFVGLYEVRENRIAVVRGYMSDRELLERLGLLEPAAELAQSGNQRLNNR